MIVANGNEKKTAKNNIPAMSVYLFINARLDYRLHRLSCMNIKLVKEYIYSGNGEKAVQIQYIYN
jgi:hypothetical protein